MEQMKMGRMMTFFLLLTVVFPLFAAAPRFPSEVVFSEGSVKGENSWDGIGTISLTYAASRKKMNLELRKQGWRLVREIEYDRIQWKSLEIWSKGNDSILLQYWREDVSLTGFSWGFWKDGKGS